MLCVRLMNGCGNTQQKFQYKNTFKGVETR